MLTILKPGVQTTIQGKPRIGHRHLGIPWSGAADALSLALANHLCGNEPGASGLEITFGNASLTFGEETVFALAGADCEILLAGQQIEAHRTHWARPGDRLEIGPAKAGMRVYLAVAGGVAGTDFLDSPSTYLPAALGGLEGRALRADDQLTVLPALPPDQFRSTPPELRPDFSPPFILRTIPSAEFSSLTSSGRRELFAGPFTSARQIDRMGIRLEGKTIKLREGETQIESAGVHQGIVQCPGGGVPIILGPDAQTTGGYPRILSVTKSDLHLLGQITPGAEVQLFLRTPEEAVADDAGRTAILESWIGEESSL